MAYLRAALVGLGAALLLGAVMVRIPAIVSAAIAAS
jgi:hypothetical protein